MTTDESLILLGYSIAFGAKRRKETYLEVFSGVWFVEAVSHDEAVGKAVARARNEYPPADGYIDHWGIAAGVSISPSELKEKLDQAVRQ